MSVTVEMSGIPYCDVFTVEVRWSVGDCGDDGGGEGSEEGSEEVGRQRQTQTQTQTQRQSRLDVKVGLYINFSKSSMFKRQIKSGTLTETTEIHLDLFNSMSRFVKERKIVTAGEEGTKPKPKPKPKPQPTGAGEHETVGSSAVVEEAKIEDKFDGEQLGKTAQTPPSRRERDVWLVVLFAAIFLVLLKQNNDLNRLTKIVSAIEARKQCSAN